MNYLEPTTLILLLLSCTAIGLVIISLTVTRTLNQKFQKSLELINSLHKHVQLKDEQLMQLDERLSAFELNKRTDSQKLTNLEHNLMSELAKLEQQVQDNELQDPTTKRYQKANELLQSGASIEEVMDICELPRAEIDILLGLMRRK